MQNQPRNTPRQPKTPQPRRRARLKKEVWYVLAVLLLIPLLWWAFSDSELEAWLDQKRIPELVQAHYYDSAVVLLDSGLANPDLNHLHPELEAQRKAILQEKLKNLYAPNFAALLGQIDSLERRYELYEAINRINTALTAEVYTEKEVEVLESQRERLLEMANRIETLDTIQILVPYTVRFGETLNGIAYRHNMQPKELIRINQIRNTQIQEGQRLRVNVPVKVDVHTVAEGESLSGIASRYGMSLTEISRFNKLKSNDFIRTGQKLRVYRRVIPSVRPEPTPVPRDTTQNATDSSTPRTDSL